MILEMSSQFAVHCQAHTQVTSLMCHSLINSTVFTTHNPYKFLTECVAGFFISLYKTGCTFMGENQLSLNLNALMMALRFKVMRNNAT